MITRQRLVSYGIPTLAAATITTAALLHQRPEPAPDYTCVHPVPIDRVPSRVVGDHAIDVVFAVDTTGSMGGLLDGAKRTVWSIATHIRKTDPNANLRIGLVAYRDLGDEYVTKPFALTNDLDAVYQELASYVAAGGGDAPEDVDAALDQTLRMKWRPDARKLVFVVGDQPPATRGEVPPYDQTVRDAAARGITINAIRCGWEDTTEVAFRTIARLGGGEYSTIQQDGGVQQVATPYDAEIATLSSEYDSTAVIMGDGAREQYKRKIAVVASAPAAAQADRAGYYGGAGGEAGRADDDLVSGYAHGSVSLNDVEATALPSDMRDRDKAALKNELEARVAKRKQLQSKMDELAKQREEYLSKQAKGGDGAFDTAVKDIVERQIK